MSRNQRRRFPIVYRSHQYRFLTLTILYAASIVAVLYSALFLPDVVALQNPDLNPEVRRLAADKILTLHVRLWPAIIAMIAIIALHSFAVFHRFIGPIYRFKKTFESIGEGDLTARMNLRAKDFLVEEEGVFNEMMDMLSGRFTDLREMGSAALSDPAAPSAGEHAGGKPLRETMEKMLAVMESLQLPERSGDAENR